MAYHAGKQRGEPDEVAEEPQEVAAAQPTTDYAPAPPADAGPDGGDLDQIAKLADLHKSGAITDAEFAAAKANLLA